MKTSLFKKKPDTLREALTVIEELLHDQRYSHDLWNVLTALRGPDSRDRKIKYATTAVIRQAAFPSNPAENLSVFKRDNAEYAVRRVEMFMLEKDTNHFREHVVDAFASLGLSVLKENK